MQYELLLAVSPLLGLFVNVVVQVCASRYISKITLLRSVYLGFAAGLFVQTCILLPGGDLYLMLADLITYFALGYGYFNFVNLGETARRVRILRELYDAGGSLSPEELLKRYNSRDMIEKRIQRLVNNGQVIYNNGRFYIGTPLVLFMAKAVTLGKFIVLGRKSEFD